MPPNVKAYDTAKLNRKNERCFSLSKQTERKVDLARHSRTRVKANFQILRKLKSRLAFNFQESLKVNDRTRASLARAVRGTGVSTPRQNPRSPCSPTSLK
jgi:hypothetical protein